MDELQSLYQEVILDHFRNPRNFKKLEGSVHSAEGLNPLCGDQIKVYLKLEGNTVKEISFQGSGCAISKASASLMTLQLKGKTVPECESLFQQFHQMVITPVDQKVSNAQLGKLEALAGVREFPVRVKCATLAWHTFQAALQDKKGNVTTE